MSERAPSPNPESVSVHEALAFQRQRQNKKSTLESAADAWFGNPDEEQLSAAKQGRQLREFNAVQRHLGRMERGLTQERESNPESGYEVSDLGMLTERFEQIAALAEKSDDPSKFGPATEELEEDIKLLVGKKYAKTGIASLAKAHKVAAESEEPGSKVLAMAMESLIEQRLTAEATKHGWTQEQYYKKWSQLVEIMSPESKTQPIPINPERVANRGLRRILKGVAKRTGGALKRALINDIPRDANGNIQRGPQNADNDAETDSVGDLLNRAGENIKYHDENDTLGFKRQALESQLKMHGRKKNRKGAEFYIPTMQEVRIGQSLGRAKRFEKQISNLETIAKRRKDNGEDTSALEDEIKALKDERAGLKARAQTLRSNIEDAENTARLGVAQHRQEAASLAKDAKQHRKHRRTVYRNR